MREEHTMVPSDPDSIRVRVAELHGWTEIINYAGNCWSGTHDGTRMNRADLPDPLNSDTDACALLDEMAEAGQAPSASR